MNKTEAERLAAMGNALRPDWPLSSLMTLLAAHRSKAYRDVAVALAWIATDPLTQTPGRLNEQGPWWKATQAGEPTFVANSTRCPAHPKHPTWACPDCDSEVADRETTQAKIRELRDELRQVRG